MSDFLQNGFNALRNEAAPQEAPQAIRSAIFNIVNDQILMETSSYGKEHNPATIKKNEEQLRQLNVALAQQKVTPSQFRDWVQANEKVFASVKDAGVLMQSWENRFWMDVDAAGNVVLSINHTVPLTAAYSRAEGVFGPKGVVKILNASLAGLPAQPTPAEMQRWLKTVDAKGVYAYVNGTVVVKDER